MRRHDTCTPDQSSAAIPLECLQILCKGKYTWCHNAARSSTRKYDPAAETTLPRRGDSKLELRISPKAYRFIDWSLLSPIIIICAIIIIISLRLIPAATLRQCTILTDLATLFFFSLNTCAIKEICNFTLYVVASYAVFARNVQRRRLE